MTRSLRTLILFLLLCSCAHSGPAGEAAETASETASDAADSGDQSAPDPSEASPADSSPAGAVAAAHPLAAEAGVTMLRAGGSAFDAAVSTALVLGVVNPQSSGLGGGGFAVFREADGSVSSLDFREMAPSFFDAEVYKDPSRDSARGPWSTGIPGEPAGLAELHRIGGKLPWVDVVEPARALAADGFPVGADLASALARRADRILADRGLRADFAPEGRVLVEGETCLRPALAETLAYLQAHGGDAFYRGPLALAISGFLSAQGPPWTPEELGAYKVRRREALHGSYRGHSVYTMGPPSSGGLAILQSLSILEVADHQAMDFAGTTWSRTLVAALAHSFADRATYGGDPDFAEIPVEALLDSELGGRLWRATPGSGPVPRLQAGLAGERGDSKALLKDDGGTSHLSAMDGFGAAVALTTTVNLSFGSLQADPQTGVVLNDEMDDFAARPGEPNAFGLVQGDNNAPGAGRRPLSSMSPTLVADAEGRVLLAVGGAGGPRIITATLQSVLGVVDRGLSVGEALAAPRLHHQWLPETTLVEAGVSDDTRAALRREGFELSEASYLAVVQATGFDPETGTWSAAADPRAGGAGLVVEVAAE